MTDADRYRAERDALRNRLRDLAAQLDAAADTAEQTGDIEESYGIRTAARIVRDQLDRRPAGPRPPVQADPSKMVEISKDRMPLVDDRPSPRLPDPFRKVERPWMALRNKILRRRA